MYKFFKNKLFKRSILDQKSRKIQIPTQTQTLAKNQDWPNLGFKNPKWQPLCKQINLSNRCLDLMVYGIYTHILKILNYGFFFNLQSNKCIVRILKEVILSLWLYDLAQFQLLQLIYRKHFLSCFIYKSEVLLK